MTRTLAEAAADASGCVRCRLSETRTQVVFGVGDPAADLLFIGEAPGMHEDRQGEPFVGAAGQLLTRMLGEIGLTREEVYIANVLKCRPPANRDPLPDEIETCTPWLVEQISLDPAGGDRDPRQLRHEVRAADPAGDHLDAGIVYPWHGRRVIPTFHPAAVLRGGGETSRQFQDLRDDFRLMRATLDEAPRRRRATPPPPTPHRRPTRRPTSTTARWGCSEVAAIVETATADDTRAVGAALAGLLVPGDVLVLTGDLGAGKTTLTQGIAKGLGATEHVASPTFTLVREYLTGRLPVAHVDVYRLRRAQDVLDLALDELDGGHDGVLIVEWGDAVGRPARRRSPADRAHRPRPRGRDAPHRRRGRRARRGRDRVDAVAATLAPWEARP